MTKTILIAEDEPRISSIISDYLKAENFNVFIVENGCEVIPKVKKENPDLIVLDIMLPEKNGLEILRELRTFSNTPVIMETARVEEIDRLLGLESGADDYICKPFSPREIVARVKAVLRRSFPSSEEKLSILKLGPVKINKRTMEVYIYDKKVKLTPYEFELLTVLIENPGFVFSRNELLKKVQGYDFDGYDRTIDSHIKNLRKKISDVYPGLGFIKSVYGVGYQLDPDFVKRPE